ncbi:hypothetical protein [Nocardioides ungokensis]|uniref:hypothetical protein n=1 Tax=Nocardioides ungokensis TaxID=1643322 RepID=UPI0015DD7EC1|nr:hypothetical protein [Nocardioides ungokensis]
MLANVICVVDQSTLLGEPGLGRMSTRRGYQREHDTLDEGHALPWTTGPDRHWSRFWSNYLSAKMIKPGAPLSADRAFDYVIPHQLVPSTTLITPDKKATATVRVRVYPTAIAVIADIELDGEIRLESLPDTVRTIRDSNAWGRPGHTADRSLDGILQELADEARVELFADPARALEPGATIIHTAVAPVTGTLSADDVRLPSPDDPKAASSIAAKTVAGLATLKPGAEFDATKLLEANTAGPARTYITSRGHSLWNTITLLADYAPDKKDPVGCLLRNHTDLVAHIDALTPIVTWAANQVRSGVGLNDSQADLARAAVTRLRILKVGGTTTYRSKLAAIRIAAIDKDLKDAASGI